MGAVDTVFPDARLDQISLRTGGGGGESKMGVASDPCPAHRAPRA